MDANTKRFALGSIFGCAIGFVFAFGLFSAQNASDLKAQIASSQKNNNKAEEVVVITETSSSYSSSSSDLEAGTPRVYQVKQKDIRSLARYIWKKCKSNDSTIESMEECMQRNFDSMKEQQKAKKREFDSEKMIDEAGETFQKKWDSSWEEDSEKRREEMLKKAEKKREEMQNQAEEKKKIYLECREESESSEELKICLQEKLQRSRDDYTKNKMPNTRPPEFLPPKKAPQRQMTLREVISKCLENESENLRECVQKAISNEQTEKGSAGDYQNKRPSGENTTDLSYPQNTNQFQKNDHEVQQDSYYLPGQLPPVESDDITNPTI